MTIFVPEFHFCQKFRANDQFSSKALKTFKVKTVHTSLVFLILLYSLVQMSDNISGIYLSSLDFGSILPET